MIRLEMSEGGSNKFWEAEREGTSLKIRFGKIGTAGQAQEKSFGSEAEVETALAKLIAEKTKKGYAVAGGAPASAATTASSSGANAPASEATALSGDPSAPGSGASTSASAAAPAKARAASKKGKLKTFSGEGMRAMAISPSASFVVVTGPQQPAGGSFTQTLTVKRADGETTFPVAGFVQGLAVLPDDRIVATVQEGWPFAKRFAEAGLLVLDPDGTERGAVRGEEHAGAASVVVDRTGTFVAFVATPQSIEHPRYLKSRLFFGRLADVLAGKALRSRDFDAATPTFAFDGAGGLVVEARAEVTTLDPATGEPAPSTGRAGLLGYLGSAKVLDRGAPVFELPANVCEHAVLEPGGRLFTLATAVQKRMGVQGQASVEWPDPEPLLRDDHLAIWDVDGKRLVRALPRAAGRIASVSLAPGAAIAVLTHANKAKVELLDWPEP